MAQMQNHVLKCSHRWKSLARRNSFHFLKRWMEVYGSQPKETVICRYSCGLRLDLRKAKVRTITIGVPAIARIRGCPPAQTNNKLQKTGNWWYIYLRHLHTSPLRRHGPWWFHRLKSPPTDSGLSLGSVCCCQPWRSLTGGSRPSWWTEDDQKHAKNGKNRRLKSGHIKVDAYNYCSMCEYDC